MTVSVIRNNIHGRNLSVKTVAPTYASEKYEVVDPVFTTLKTNIDEDIAEKETTMIVYDGMTMQQLIDKLNRSLKNELAGKGELFATYSLQKGVDPQVAVAIVLHETGCNYKCSSLTVQCNNVGGMKTGNKCGNSSYGAFESLDAGIIAYIDNLYNNYYAKGLNTVEAIHTRYASGTTWSSKVNNYISKIRAS